MGSEDERKARTRDLTFSAKSQLMDAEDVKRALWRMAHEIVERNHSLEALSVIGLQTGGTSIASALASILSEVSGEPVKAGLLDVSFYRDDLSRNPIPASSATDIDHDLTDRTVVLVDDVLFTGRTVRGALNALSDWGRPRAVQLAVLVDRGHRELPIRPDYVGKNLPTSLDEAIVATLEGVWIGTKERS
ncbi:MAG TPA: bifunctional pyr operon transcriptional regulator/uracil phosphoribosyltransferase PyrR [Acidimicrobiales bacterium]|nr:bifunctional pyr operon transcriptional regulator/uracil phosphoribosyltransferase PyrR [Acidimicrobiales bacterium]